MAALVQLLGVASREPSPGDLIEISRGLYEHWAVYVGDGYVVHLVNLGSGFSSSSSSSFGIGMLGLPTGKIKKEKLREVVEDDNWRVNNKYDDKHDPRPAQEIVDESLSMVGRYMDYNVMTFNCEHFATERRYGKGKCAQVKEAVTNPGGAIVKKAVNKFFFF